MCAGWGKYPNESEWKLGRVRIMLQIHFCWFRLKTRITPINPHGYLYKTSYWKQCIVGSTGYLLWVKTTCSEDRLLLWFNEQSRGLYFERKQWTAKVIYQYSQVPSPHLKQHASCSWCIKYKKLIPTNWRGAILLNVSHWTLPLGSMRSGNWLRVAWACSPHQDRQDDVMKQFVTMETSTIFELD